MVLGDSREGLGSPGCLEDEDEEKLLKQAIALSLEGTEENDIEEKDTEAGGDEEKEEPMLTQAIALSLEGAEEDYQDLDLDWRGREEEDDQEESS